MRKAIDPSPMLDVIPIQDIPINPKSRDDIDCTLRILQKIGSTAPLRDRLLLILEKHLSKNTRQDVGRPGMSYWRIFVLVVMKNALNCDFERLTALANSHMQLRLMLQHGIWEDTTIYHSQTITDNLSKISENVLRDINPIIEPLGLKKMSPLGLERQSSTLRGEKAEGPPTDVAKLNDALLRYIDMAAEASSACNVAGWRQLAKAKRNLDQAIGPLGQSTNYSKNPKPVVNYLRLCAKMIKKCDHTHAIIAETNPDSPWVSQLREAGAEVARLKKEVVIHKMKVTVLTNEYPPNIYGGAGVHVKYLVRELASHYRVQVYTFGRQRRSLNALSIKGISAKGAPEGGDPRFNKLFRTLQRNLSMAAAVDKTDIIHCHTWYSHWAGVLSKQLTGAKLVLTTHSLEPHRPWKVEQLGHAYHVSSWIEKTAYQTADAVIAVSPQMKEDVVALYGIRPRIVHVIPNGIDLDEYRPTFDESVLDTYGINPQLPYVLFVGRITRQKGIIHLLHAIAHLDAGTQIVLAAGAPDTSEIEAEMIQEVENLKKTGNHQIVWISEMMPPSELIILYSHAQVFVCPSVYEPFGIINLEAMACETAVVATNVGGIPMVVKDGETGLLVEFEGDGFERRLADKINLLMRDQQLSRSMGIQGRARVEAEFSWDVVAQMTAKLYQRLLRKVS